MLRLLGITAHPDDEAGAFGGSLLLYGMREIETHVICLTPGQAATHKGQARSEEELAKLRRAELAASCRILKVKTAEVLDYPDGKLDRLNFYEVVGELTLRVRKIRPQVILTLGPEGAITGHVDHSMASIFATMAYHWAAHSGRYPEQLKDGISTHQTQKLYYATASFLLPDRPPVSPPPYTAAIDISSCLEAKISAFRAHTTQTPLMDRVEKTLRKFGAKELFHLAAKSRPSENVFENDLFADVED
jgi:LmbE family N-acetylglucosaminyl deacetylase